MVMSVLRVLDLILAQSHLYKRKELRGHCFPSQTGQQANAQQDPATRVPGGHQDTEFQFHPRKS